MAVSASGSDGLWSAFLGGTSPRLLLEDIYRASRGQGPPRAPLAAAWCTRAACRALTSTAN